MREKFANHGGATTDARSVSSVQGDEASVMAVGEGKSGTLGGPPTGRFALNAEVPLLAARRRDQDLRIGRLGRRIHLLRRLRVLLAVGILTASSIAAMELREPLQLTNQGWELPNPALVLACCLAALGWFRQGVTRQQLLEAQRQLAEELTDRVRAVREASPMSMLQLVAYAAAPAMALSAAWSGGRAFSPEVALARAVRDQDLAAAERAIQRGARTNYLLVDHQSFLQGAIERNDNPMAEFLLRHGADPMRPASNPPIWLAIALQRREVVRQMLPRLRGKKAPLTPLELSFFLKDVPMIRRELSPTRTPLSEEQLRLTAARWGATWELREAQRTAPEAPGDAGN